MILTINGGSSSIKFAVFSVAASPERFLSGQVERIGTTGARLTANRTNSLKTEPTPVAAATFDEGIQSILAYLRTNLGALTISAIGHRIVHGGLHLLDHQLINAHLIAELRRAQPLDLSHLPREISLIEGFGKAFPGIPQIACFDTVFHRDPVPTCATFLQCGPTTRVRQMPFSCSAIRPESTYAH